MKLSEADFRPRQRARRVPSTTRRKIPVVRILILIVAAALVYKRFDSIWPGAHLKKSHSKQTSGTGLKGFDADGLPVWVFSKDSTQAVLNCEKSSEAECCEALDDLHSGFCGDARALVQKARWLHKLDQSVAKRFEARIQPSGSGSTLATLISVAGHSKTDNFQFTRTIDLSNADGSSIGPWCESSGDCLVPSALRTPLVQGKMVPITQSEDATSNGTATWTSHIPEVFPVLSGTVSGIDSLGPGRYRVTLYHGKELYSSYEPLRRVAMDLKTGVVVSSHRPIGEATTDTLATADSKHTIQFQIVQAGMPLDAGDLYPVEKRKPNVP